MPDSRSPPVRLPRAFRRSSTTSAPCAGVGLHTRRSIAKAVRQPGELAAEEVRVLGDWLAVRFPAAS